MWLAALVRLAPQFLKTLIAPAIVAVEFVAHRILRIIVLVIILGLEERSGLDDLGLYHARCEFLLHRLLRRLGELSLLLVMIENRRPVLVAAVAELAVFRQRIVVVPEHVEQLLIADLGGVVSDLNRLGVPGAAGRNLFVGRLVALAAGIARGRADHARHLVEIGLHAPEAAAGEGGER